MKGEHRLAVYLLVTAIVEGPSIVILYSLGYPSSSDLAWSGSLVLLIALNVVFVFIALGAIGGYESSASQRSVDPLVLLGAGVFSMFVIMTVIGEGINWLSEKFMEMTSEDELSGFNKRLNRAVHDFVDASYSPTEVQNAAETRIVELYSKHPELVDKYLSETLDRIRKIGTPRTAARVEALINELHDGKKKEQPSLGWSCLS
jgi:hypothetical protein